MQYIKQREPAIYVVNKLGIFKTIIIIIIILFTHGVQFTYRGLPGSRVLLLLTNFEFKTL